MKFYLLTLLFLTIFSIFGCSSAPEAEKAAQQLPANATNTAQNQTTTEAAPVPVALTPTDTLKALNTATEKKEIATVKTYLSRGTIQMLEESAAEQKMTIDELLTKENSLGASEPKILGEKVEGETAIVQVENTVNKQPIELPFVKENGVWKLAMDVFMRKLNAEAEAAIKEAETEKSKSDK